MDWYKDWVKQGKKRVAHTWIIDGQLKGALCLPIKVGDCKAVLQKIEHVREYI